jgi:hypothetical protein
MKKLWKGACALVLFTLGVLAAGPGCVDAEAPFFIISAMAPSCDTITVDSPVLGRGVMDLRYKCGYDAVLLLGNQLVRRGDDNTLKTETSRVSVTRFDVQLLDASENPITRPDGSAAEFSYPSTGFVDAGRAGQFGKGLSSTLLVDGATAQAIGDTLLDTDATNDITTIIARVTGFGRTLGGTDVKTRPWDFPIEITYGSLCSCGPDATSENACPIFQDFSFSCAAMPNLSCERIGCVAGP